MTHAPINHRKCDHPATKAGRAACRKAVRKIRAEIAAEIAPIKIGDKIMAKLDDAPWQRATVMAIHPWGSGLRYMCKFPSGNVWGTCQVRKP